MKLGMIKGQPVQITNEDGKWLARPVIGADDALAASLAEITTNQLGDATPLALADLEVPVPVPQQIFAVGMNYVDHSKEIHIELPKAPSIFTKFSSSLTRSHTEVAVHGDQTDWETELVVVIGKDGRNISKTEAANYVAGYMVGLDLSDREVQFLNATPQFSMAKSFAGFGPVGPWLTTPDEVASLGDLQLTTHVNGEKMQSAHLNQMIFDVPTLIEYLSSIVELKTGDLIFTGTPSGVGNGRNPQVYLRPGDKLESHIDGLGDLSIKMK
ncbi:fumarylacetoacetate hydrolase [Secundilactobacillus oryzae JCM 18671]|uniref:Fumarylacetoacetate hydrolase n=1 Tax=Secundilactobacillus oryzae JCM 18671 TaxID=1291743 RepID=A0A081BGB7_9LACO|nr:fumarylacetoacetate hydrolase family protein [Secundilactobacillus oryzae]GAK47085.1 fumarylacetoacetate hydrolase [Secundilactobacillus oryzae JCM 18671]